MKWKVRQPKEKRNLENWNKWFAWIPVKLVDNSSTMIWLEAVECRRVRRASSSRACIPKSGFIWEYRLIKQV